MNRYAQNAPRPRQRAEEENVNGYSPATPHAAGKAPRTEPSTAGSAMRGRDSPPLSANQNVTNGAQQRRREPSREPWSGAARPSPGHFLERPHAHSRPASPRITAFAETGQFEDIQVLSLEADDSRLVQLPPVDLTVVRDVEVPVQNIIYKRVEMLVERPVVMENYVEMRRPVDVIVEREILIPVEHLVERPVYIERPVELHVDYLVEMPRAYEQITEVPVEHRHEVRLQAERAVAAPVERVVRKSVARVQRVETGYDAVIERLVPQHVDHIITCKRNRYVERPVERLVERMVYIDRVVERAKEVERIIEIPLEHIREVVRTVERVVERPVYYETVLEKEVEIIVERVVEVLVEKTIEVPITIYVDRPVIQETLHEEDVVVETITVEVSEEAEVTVEDEFFDEQMEAEINTRRAELEAASRENGELLQRMEQAHRDLFALAQNCASPEHEAHVHLLVQYTDSASRYNAASQHRLVLEGHVKQRCLVVEHHINDNPMVEQLRGRMHRLLAENEALIRQLEQRRESVLRTLHEGPLC